MDPLLFRFKQKCSTQANDYDQFYYDENQAMTLVKNSLNVPAIHYPGNLLPGTKKADLEKGEDSKDTMMWC